MYCRDEKGRFIKGNKGGMIGKVTRIVEKGTHLNPETEFKKGQYVGANHSSWKGGLQYIKKDVVYLWSGCNKRVRRSRKVYEERRKFITGVKMRKTRKGEPLVKPKHNEIVDEQLKYMMKTSKAFFDFMLECADKNVSWVDRCASIADFNSPCVVENVFKHFIDQDILNNNTDEAEMKIYKKLCLDIDKMSVEKL